MQKYAPASNGNEKPNIIVKNATMDNRRFLMSQHENPKTPNAQKCSKCSSQPETQNYYKM